MLKKKVVSLLQVEVLRTSTAEPTNNGIHWKFEKVTIPHLDTISHAAVLILHIPGCHSILLCV
jgi:Peptide N-acetyl-beta-D-glucosaminyl asparaginase amidase A